MYEDGHLRVGETHLEYVNQSNSPYLKMDIYLLER